MEERFTKLNDFYGPAAGTALRPFTTAPAAGGDRRMQYNYSSEVSFYDISGIW